MLTLDQAGAGVPRSRVVAPPPELAPWVEAAVIQGPRPLPPGGWLIVPDPNPHVVVSLCDDGTGRAVRSVLVGARSRAAGGHGRRLMTLIVRFRAGALPALTGTHAAAFTDRGVRLEDALRVPVSRLEDRVAAGDGPGALRHLFDLLAARLRDRPGVDWRVRALEGAARRSPGEVSARSGIPSRSLRSVAASDVGLPPAGILRIRRLQHALTLRLSGAEGSWTAAAYRSGFHDPAHLVRTARELLGETPEAFRRRRADLPG